MAANTWFVMIPPTYTSKSTSEKELVDFVIQYQAGSQAWTLANSGQIVQGAVGNTGNPQVSEQLVKWQGPYATQAAAKTAANPQQQSVNPVNDATNAAENSNSILSLPSFEHLRPFMVRVVKVVLGGVLIIAGLTMLVKQETNISVSDVAKVAAV
jgi:hypothetical protein